MSGFTDEQMAYMEAHKHESRVHEIYWVYSVPIVAATLSTSLRLLAKRVGRNGITLDDYLIVFATICVIGQCASGIGYGAGHGMGRHVIVVSPHDQMMVRRGDYVFSHFYDLALVSVKLGILAFYYRVFVVPLFRKFVLATVAFVIGWGIGITVTLAVICRPIEAFWDASVRGKCLHLVEFTYFTNITNLITDVWIFLMPIPVIWHLQLQTKKKLLLCFIFSIGLATCVVSAVRLTVVLGHGYPDFTWSYVPLGAYSAFEPLGGILCTNLPIIWHMWRKRRPILPTVFKSPASSTATPGSAESRRSRFARSLGLSTHDQTGTDSQSRTILGNDEDGAQGWQEAPGSTITDKDGNTTVVAQPRPAQYWNKVERSATLSTHEEMAETENAGMSRVRSTGEASGHSGKQQGADVQKAGMKKNVWEVRKK